MAGGECRAGGLARVYGAIHGMTEGGHGERRERGWAGRGAVRVATRANAAPSAVARTRSIGPCREAGVVELVQKPEC
eukprot:7380442-Prymnesium_polylepis.1